MFVLEKNMFVEHTIFQCGVGLSGAPAALARDCLEVHMEIKKNKKNAVVFCWGDSFPVRTKTDATSEYSYHSTIGISMSSTTTLFTRHAGSMQISADREENASDACEEAPFLERREQRGCFSLSIPCLGS